MSQAQITTAPARTTPGAPVQQVSGRRLLRQFVRSESATGIGFVQIAVGLAAIWTAFSVLNPNFVSPANLTNLALQIIAMAAIGIGVALVLLIGQIDLSVGSVSGMAATTVGALNIHLGIPAIPALLAGLAAGAVVGLVHGAVIAGFGVPSFVVTLGGLIAWQGLQLYIFDRTGAMNITDPNLLGVTGTFLQPWIGWLLLIAALMIKGMFLLHLRRRRVRAGVGNVQPWVEGLRFAFMAAIPALGIVMFVQDRGIPLAVVVVLLLITGMDLVARRTLFGRRIYAVGGDAQAAGRAGMNVNFVVVSVFMLSGVFAALGGILSAARLESITQSAGSGDVLLNAIAAVIIGGTSLFGGRGSVWSALLGALIIGSISNGMDLLAMPSPIKLMITGAVLVTAVVFDAAMRRRQAR